MDEGLTRLVMVNLWVGGTSTTVQSQELARIHALYLQSISSMAIDATRLWNTFLESIRQAKHIFDPTLTGYDGGDPNGGWV